MSIPMRIKYTLTVAALFFSCSLFSQKRPVDHNVYDSWKNISRSYISPSGELIYYVVSPQEGDKTVELKNQKNDLLIQLDRGDSPVLSIDENFLIAKVSPFFEEIRQDKIKKKKADELTKDSLVIYNISEEKLDKLGPIKSYKTAFRLHRHFAFLSEAEYLKESLEVSNDEEETTTNKGREKKKEKSSILHIYDLNTGDTTNIWRVEDYMWSPDEKQLVFTKKASEKDSLSNIDGVYVYNTNNQEIKKISNGKGKYRSFTYDDKGETLAFLADKSDESSTVTNYTLYLYTTDLDSAVTLVSGTSPGIPENWILHEKGKVAFSENGKKLYFGISPTPVTKDTTLIDFDHAKVDIWHWKDDYLQTQQLVNLKQEQEKSFPAVLHLQSRNIIALADEKSNNISFTDNANEEWALLRSDYGRRLSGQWEGYTRADYSLISTETGIVRDVIENFNGQAYLSPKANYVLLFDRDNGSWLSFNIETGKTVLLNDEMPVSFADEQNDMPALPRSYGIAGWTTDGKGVLLNDRYDVWHFTLDGQKKRLATNGYGRANHTVLRYISPTPKQSSRERMIFIEPSQDVLLSAFNEKNKYHGLYKTKPSKNRNPKQLFLEAFTFRHIASDQAKKNFIYTKEDYVHSPDLYWSDLKNESQLTVINSQQSDYNWGTAELITWKTPNGHDAEGILYKPEDFDPHKKYPIIAYFYETLSHGLYSYHAPAPTPSRLNIPYFVSNGYLVFAPDIRYENGYPGKSAEEYVNSGMSHLTKNSWVDSTKMGIQGQSWGGYQVAHLITRTDMYAAAWAGAPVVNMTSAYGGIRWQSGMSRQFQYENTQSRIGTNLWDAHELYIENSPLFYMNRVNTPVAIMHNDNDGAVPWYQGVEMFTALRRLQKPVWLLNYNGDEHNLMKRQNRKDIQRREAQFFDHFLKGIPPAPWIEHGVPAIKKGIDWGFE